MNSYKIKINEFSRIAHMLYYNVTLKKINKFKILLFKCTILLSRQNHQERIFVQLVVTNFIKGVFKLKILTFFVSFSY